MSFGKETRWSASEDAMRNQRLWNQLFNAASTRAGLRVASLSLLIALLGSLIDTQEGNAQPVQRARVPALVVLVDTLPDPVARAMIMRRAHDFPMDMILLTPATATARQLSAAVFTLLVVRAKQGETPSRDNLVRVVMTEGPEAWIDTEERRAEAVVRRLRRANPQYVAGFGLVPSTTLYLPVNVVR
jgi:hypothetical protein